MTSQLSDILNQYTELSSEIEGEVRVFKGTRVSVWFVIALIAEAWTQEEMAKHYPSVPPAAIAAVFKWCEAQQDLRETLNVLRQAS